MPQACRQSRGRLTKLRNKHETEKHNGYQRYFLRYKADPKQTFMRFHQNRGDRNKFRKNKILGNGEVQSQEITKQRT